MKRTTLSTLTALLLAGVAVAHAQQPGAVEKIAALKANLAASKAALRHYEWIETTVVSLNGEEKSRKQQRCYYGADGGLQKVEIDSTPPPQEPRGPFRRRIMERKKEEMTDYMKSAVSLVKSYVPPSRSKIQDAKDASRLSFAPLGSGRAEITIRDYEKPGDSYVIKVDMATARPLSLRVATYLNGPGDPVTLNVTMGQLNGGTSYPDDVTLNAPSKGITVSVHNSGYRKAN